MRIVLIALVLALAPFARAADNKSGDIKLSAASAEPVKVSLGERLKLDAELKRIKVGAGSAVSVGGDIENKTDQKVFYSYHVALLDKDNKLIGCQSFSLWVDPGKKAKAGTFISLPADQIDKIAHYSIAYYEGDKAIGK